MNHPLQDAYDAAILQATEGKGKRHGGDTIPFLEQRWMHKADCHGIGFLTGQSSKKIDESVEKEALDDFERELLGAIVYAGMAYLFLQKMKKKESQQVKKIESKWVPLSEDYLKEEEKTFRDKDGTIIKEGDYLFNPFDEKKIYQVLKGSSGRWYLGDFESPLEKYSPDKFWTICTEVGEIKELNKNDLRT